ncbi:MAG: molybdate ABC transporter substrate-binding protein [Caulobacteraceae bacterium]
MDRQNPRIRFTRRAALGALAGIATPAILKAQDASMLTVFAAASLKEALNTAGWVYVAQFLHPVRFSYGASSALARQIEQGAPADVFISADVDWMDYLAKKRLIVAATRRNLLSNHLALIAPAKAKVSLAIEYRMPLAKALGGGRLAIAGPDVPAGRYGQAALTKLGVWDQVKDRLAPAENVRAALNFVARGEAPLGIVYDTDAKIEPAVKIVGLFPDSSHPPIVYPGAVVATSKNPNAKPFLDSLISPLEARVFRKYGFRVLRK